MKCRNFFAIVSILKILVLPDSSGPLLCYNRTFPREVSQVTRAWLIGRSGGSQNRSRAIGDLDQISSGFDRFWVVVFAQIVRYLELERYYYLRFFLYFCNGFAPEVSVLRSRFRDGFGAHVIFQQGLIPLWRACRSPVLTKSMDYLF